MISRADGVSRTGMVASFYSNENNEPPHVHMFKGSGEVKFWLKPVSVATSYGLKTKEIAAAAKLVEKHEDEILEAWRKYFGR